MTDLSEQAAALREPPHSIEAEQSVLGGLLLDSTALSTACEVLTRADFFRHEHQIIFGAIEAIVRRGEVADAVTVFTELEGEPSDFGGLAYLNSLAQSVPGAANLRRYAEVVAERATMRSIIALADSVTSRAFSQRTGAAALLDDARAEMAQVEQARNLTSRRVRLLTLSQLREMAQAVTWLVKHAVPGDAVGMIFGATGAFKSFIAVDLALHVVHGLPWLGRKTVKGSVIYIAAEGGSGVWRRADAWHTARGLRCPDAQLYVLPAAIDLRVEAWRVVEAAQALGVTPALVVVDTLSQTYTGEENSANEMAAYLREIGQRFRALWGCAVILVHHSGHSATERPRGSSAIKQSIDFLLGVFREEKEMLTTLTCEKLKEEETFKDHTFALTKHTVGTDSDGDEITSLVARHLSSAEEVQVAMQGELNAGRGGKHQLLLSLVQNGMLEAGLRKAFYEDCGLDTAESRRQAYHRAKKWAISQGFIEVAEGRVLSLKREQTA
jgi:KaiC/GvpD/RAD55 family RecA-like ATPase